MNHLLDLLEHVQELLRPALPGVRIVTAYDPQNAGPGAPRRTVTLSLEGAETVENANDYLGALSSQEEALLRGRLVDLTLRMVLLGGERGAKGCYELLDSVLQVLFFEAGELYLHSVQTERAQYDAAERSVSLCCRFTLRCLITRQEESGGYQNVVIRRKED
ncbi:hypothetical protein [Harryflintia acetispora]|uniref:hypothetical protein n=1 Tax=Harryflintia acetispora TaxID=1849041 RepID=UPI001899BD4F|nr:hypothetical protein [Harryflintia acetispora]